MTQLSSTNSKQTTTVRFASHRTQYANTQEKQYQSEPTSETRLSVELQDKQELISTHQNINYECRWGGMLWWCCQSGAMGRQVRVGKRWRLDGGCLV